MRRAWLCLILCCLIGCEASSVSTYHVTSGRDNFNEVRNGTMVTFFRWTLHVNGQKIEIPHEESTITVKRAGSRVTIDVNGKTVYEG